MTCTTKCALCGEVLDQYLPYLGVERTVAAHHVGCPKRPIEVGDYVEWKQTATHIMGEVVEILDDKISIRVDYDRAHPRDSSWQGTTQPLSRKQHGLRRIPRPAEAQAVPVFPAGADRSQPCPMCSRTWGEHFGIACSTFDRDRPCIACGDPLGEHLKLVGCRGPSALAPNPATELVDGMDREVCHARWMENRLAVEGGAAPPNVLKPEQIAAGRALWLQRFGAQRSAELRERVAADREAERNRVRVEVQDVD